MNKKVIITLSYWIGLFVMNSCTKTMQTGDAALVYPSPEKVTILIDSVIYVDSSTCIKLALKNKRFRIVEAYFDCGTKTEERELSVDGREIKNCNKKLLVEDDTVKINVAYNKVGKHQFHDVTLLCFDENKKELSFVDTSFSLNVVPIRHN